MTAFPVIFQINLVKFAPLCDINYNSICFDLIQLYFEMTHFPLNSNLTPVQFRIHPKILDPREDCNNLKYSSTPIKYLIIL